jgi:hypothetical protein
MTASSTLKNQLDLDCSDDGLYYNKVGPWSISKLSYLSRYLNITTTAMHSGNWREFHYIDLFSGPGKSKVKGKNKIICGSPLIALTQSKRFDKCYFVDQDDKAVVALENRCQALSTSTTCQFYNADGNLAAKKVVDEIARIDKQFIKGKWCSFNVAFLDPYGLELKWSTVELLASIKVMDLIIFYPQMALTRAMPVCLKNQSPCRIDEFFGDEGWKEIYEFHLKGKLRNVHRELMDHYWSKLKKLGYKENKELAPLMRSDEKRAPLYRLICASKNELGKKFWGESTKIDDAGQERLF